MGTEATALANAITVIKAAFSADADDNTRQQGEHVLETMLTALRGARDAPDTPTADAPPVQAPSIPKPKPQPPNMLDYIIHIMKDQLDDDDRATVEAEKSAFNVPFINV